MQGKSRELKIKADKFNRIENALEIWYDQTPILEKIEMTFFENREQFLLHSLQNNPQNIIFDYNDPFINEIKKDEKTYNKILNLIKEEIQKGDLKGEIITGGTPETEINFKNPDLATSIHGIKKIQYEAIEKNGDFEEVFEPEKGLVVFSYIILTTFTLGFIFSIFHGIIFILLRKSSKETIPLNSLLRTKNP